MISEKEIQALVTLLEDPDQTVYKELEKNLLKRGTDFVPDLELVWENSLNELLHSRIEYLIETIQFSSIISRIGEWVSGDSFDLLFGAYLIAKYQYPDLTYRAICEQVDLIAKDVEKEINEYLSPLEKVRVLNHIIFDVHRFSGYTANFFAPQNSFINYVLDSKKGNTYSLAILYAAVAQQLNISIYGVDLPKNFILAFVDYKSFKTINRGSVFFYINPFNKGAVLGQKEINYFLRQQQIESREEYYVPCSNAIIIERLVEHLIKSNEKLGYPDKVTDLKKILKVLQSSLFRNNDTFN